MSGRQMNPNERNTHMSTSGNDNYGLWIDTGTNTVPAACPNVTTEQHIGQTVIDTGSTLTAAQITASHIPQRSATSPR